MNTWQLVKRYSERQGISQKAAAEHLDGILEVIKEALLEEDSVILKGIGKLITKELAPKRGVTPRGMAHEQPARLTIRIVPSRIFKNELNASRRVD